jgi:hypothetical protein
MLIILNIEKKNIIKTFKIDKNSKNLLIMITLNQENFLTNKIIIFHHNQRDHLNYNS